MVLLDERNAMGDLQRERGVRIVGYCAKQIYVKYLIIFYSLSVTMAKKKPKQRRSSTRTSTMIYLSKNIFYYITMDFVSFLPSFYEKKKEKHLQAIKV